ncbi:MAG: hypothetical protein IT196_25085 [Acidimicrobiales bacterium]|nr:hypothetical protein [Acidimicrobiales bacterium]
MTMPRPVRPAAAYARAATNWPVLLGCDALVVAILIVVSRWPAALWPLHGAAIGLVGGASAGAVDERCASVVDVAARPLWWRTAARSTTPTALAATWVLAHLLLRDRLPDHLALLAGQGAVAAAIGLAAGTIGRVHGGGRPGWRLAIGAVPLVIAAAIARPFEQQLPLFPVWPHEDWERSSAMWVAGAGAAVAAIVHAVHLDARPLRRSRPGR